MKNINSINKREIDRRDFLGMSAGAAVLGMLGWPQFGSAQTTWNQGQLVHLIPTASHERFLIKASFKAPLTETPRLSVNGKPIEGVRIDIQGRFWRFDAPSLQAAPADILYLFRRPGQLVRAILSINVIMPIFAVLLVLIFQLDPVIEVALVALAVSPVPPILPNKAFKSGGERSFTFGLLAAISILSLVMVPLVLNIFGALLDRHAKFSEFAVIKTILMTVIAPLFLGMIIRYFAPSFSEKVAGPLGKFAMLLLILVFLPVLIVILPLLWSLIGNGTILAIVAFTIVGVTAGHFLGGPDPGDRTVLALATSSRHPAIAISLAVANVGETETKLAAAAIVLYLLVSGIVATPYLHWLGRNNTQEKEVTA